MSRKTILIIEDEEDIRSLLQTFFAKRGYAVLTAENGKDALEVLASEPEQPGAILLDIMMPVMDGHAFLARLEELEGYRWERTAIIVLSASAVTASPRVSSTMRKPFSLRELLAVVEKQTETNLLSCA